jgi:hypothetical protein
MDSEVFVKICQVLNDVRQSDGWADLARVGKPLNDLGVNYKALGYWKLREYFEAEFPDNIDIKVDKTHQTPVYYARQKIVNNTINMQPSQQTVTSKPMAARGNHIPDRLHLWSFIDFHNAINTLERNTLKERWYYKIQEPTYPFPILAKYLSYTFYRLVKEKTKICVNERYAAFNTGLVNNLYEPLYALFEKNRIPNRQEWYFHEFCVSGVGQAGKILASNFNPLPFRADYFNNPADLIYDVNAPEPQLNWDHIILENIARFPVNFLEENKPSNFAFRDTSVMSTLDKIDFYEQLAQAIQNDNKKFRTIKNRLSDSLDTALKRVAWNFKTAIPMYFPRNNGLSLLLPLSLVDDDIIDLALVTEKTKSGNYLGHTILPLDWAYSNARLITRPDSDWLIAEQITSRSDDGLDESNDE